jgi:two-component system phosphate regulon sensor histidine kinase PhoR
VAAPLKHQPSTRDKFIIGGILYLSFLGLAVLSKAHYLTTILIFFSGGLAMWIYMRVIKTPTSTKKRIKEDKPDIQTGHLETIAEALPRAILILDRNANEGAVRLLSPDMIGKPIGAYLRATGVRSHIAQAFDGEIPPSLSVQLLHPTERYLDVDFSKAIEINLNGQADSIVCAVLADRTQTRMGREQRADFLANASHELKTPIASMKGIIETLLGHAKDDAIAREKFLKIMAEQAERMERLVTDLLSLRSIESREHLLPSATADLCKAIEAAQDSLILLAQDKGVEMSISLPEGREALTSGKTDECIQLFLNLMQNGIKLSSEGAALRVTLEQLPNWAGQAFPDNIDMRSGFRRIVNLAPSESPVWRVIISDEGPGFAKTHLPRIGERFYRVAGDLPAQEKGTGLGLAIVKHIVRRHRGGLFVKTIHRDDVAEGPYGTSFSVIFPVVNAQNDDG